jgi:hypothetical protein
MPIQSSIAEIPPQPPFAKGGRGDFWGIFSKGKSYLFQKAKVLLFLFRRGIPGFAGHHAPTVCAWP